MFTTMARFPVRNHTSLGHIRNRPCRAPRQTPPQAARHLGPVQAKAKEGGDRVTVDGQADLIARLESWAASTGVTPRWVRGVLRLEQPDGTAKAVVTFPLGFWEAFPIASMDRQQDAMDVIVADVQALYDPAWKEFDAKSIEVHSALLKES